MNSPSLRSAIISGASSGIGKAVAENLAGAGYSLGLNGRAKSKLEDSFPFGETNSTVFTVGDIADYAVAKGLVDATVAAFGGVNTVVVNAGIGFFGPFVDTPLALMEEIVRTNTIGSVNLARAAIPELVKNKVSNLVFISSTAGFRGGANEAVYAATKHSQIGLAGSLDREFRSQGLRVCVIAPGSTQTDFAGGTSRGSSKTVPAEFLNPQVVAESVLFALSLPDNARIQQINILPMSQQA
jgi:short-subunit dehydrogenase